MVLHKSVFNLFILLKIRSAVQVDTGYVNNVHSNINSGIELRVAMKGIKGLNQSLWLHITIHSTPLLPPSFDVGFEFALGDFHVTAE